MTTAYKKQLYKDAEDYARQLGVYVDKQFRSDVELAYVDGATAENERAQQELQAYRDIIKELLPIAEHNHEQNVKYFGSEKWPSTHTESLISRARKLIDTVTPI